MFWHKRIGFRPVEKKDLESIRKLRNEPSTYMYLTHVKQINETEQLAWFEKMQRDPTVAYFSITEEIKEFPVSYEGKFLGILRMDEIDVNNRSARIGLDIVPEERNKGIGSETFEGFLLYCFNWLNLHRLWLCVLENNEVAIKLYNHIGFKEEGRYREAIFRDGKYLDYIVMSILDHEFKKLKKTRA